MLKRIFLELDVFYIYTYRERNRWLTLSGSAIMPWVKVFYVIDIDATSLPKR